MSAAETLKLKLRLRQADEWAFGPGRADLLEAIDRHGSISAAARALDMSYRRAWLMVDSMNRCFCPPLVTTAVGAGRSNGTHLTDTGRTILTAYRALEARLIEMASDDPAMHLLERHLKAPNPKRLPE